LLNVKLIKDIVKNKIQIEKLCQLNSKVNLKRLFYRTEADKKLRKKYFKHKNNIINENIVYLDNEGEQSPDGGGSPFFVAKKILMISLVNIIISR
jgi:hypothetical protein